MKLTIIQLKQIIKEALELTEVSDAIKPKYKGDFVGQTCTMNGQTIYKNVSWMKDGQRHFGKVPSLQKIMLVWDGDDWITMAEFRRGKKLAPGEKETIEDFLKRNGKVRKI